MSIKLPKYVTIRKRKGGQRFYFQVPQRVRPQKWPSKPIRLNDDPAQMFPQAEELYKRLIAERGGAPLQSSMKGSIPWLLTEYHKNERYKKLAKTTQDLYDYNAHFIKVWSKVNGDPHVRNLKRPNIFKFLQSFDEQPTKKKNIYTFLRVLLQFAVDMGEIDVNPALNMRLVVPDPEVHIWTQEEIDLFVKTADEKNLPVVGDAILTAFEIGQRQGDILKMEYGRDYAEGRFIFRQNKTKEFMSIKATPILAGRLTRGSGPIIPQLNGKRFLRGNFTKLFNRVREACNLGHCQFNHLRHTAVVSLARAGCPTPEIAAITGHTLASVNAILKRYLPRDSKVADNAIDRREDYRKTLDTSKKPA